jgi:hypothetical protein
MGIFKFVWWQAGKQYFNHQDHFIVQCVKAGLSSHSCCPLSEQNSDRKLRVPFGLRKHRRGLVLADAEHLGQLLR